MKKLPAVKIGAAVLILCCTVVFNKPVSASSTWVYRTGVYKYDVLIDGKKMGSAHVKKERKSGNFTTYSEIAFNMEGITSVSKETIVENADFLPVSYETDASFISDRYISRLKLRSWFADDFLYLNDGRTVSKFKAGGPFYYGTNKLLSTILSQTKVEGASAAYSVFDPAVETKRTLSARGRHIANVTVNYKGKIVEAYRVLADYGPLKKIEMTVDKNGIIYSYLYIVNGESTEMRLVSISR